MGWVKWAACCVAGVMPLGALAQTKPVEAQRFPYTFSNFVWWTDAALRHELKKHVHGLSDTVAEGSAEEGRMREALTKLLAKRHIQASVQSIDPTSPQGISFARAPGAPEPGIVFRIVAPPEITVETVTADASLPAAAKPEVTELNRTMSAHPYAADTFWWREQRVQGLLADGGYMTSTVKFVPGVPHGDAAKVLVPVTVTATLGPQFHVGDLTVDGGPLLEGRELTRYAAIHPGDVASAHGFERLDASIKALYQGKGYADVAVQADPVLDREHALADYHVRVVPGPQYKVSALQIQGLSPAQAGEVRAMLRMKVGDLYNERLLGELYKKIKSSPVLVKQTFGYTVKRERKDATVELTLEFSHQR